MRLWLVGQLEEAAVDRYRSVGEPEPALVCISEEAHLGSVGHPVKEFRSFRVKLTKDTLHTDGKNKRTHGYGWMTW